GANSKKPSPNGAEYLIPILLGIGIFFKRNIFSKEIFFQKDNLSRKIFISKKSSANLQSINSLIRNIIFLFNLLASRQFYLYIDLRMSFIKIH
ncbi:MAG: hypothetical protein KA146_01975, partial [Leptospiraceae bacterium]|nr:hypothetical protein [Leptospiraceae bacterium]